MKGEYWQSGMRSGKSWLMKQMLEELLDRGESVAVLSHLGVVIYKRKKHLTCMELRK